jgi:general L-amino acid transport system substrate-binding protein
MVEAEKRGLRKATVDDELASRAPLVRELVSVEPGYGRMLGLDYKWAFNVIKQVGNYGEVYDGSLGADLILKFARGVNTLWGKGEVMYSLLTH